MVGREFVDLRLEPVASSSPAKYEYISDAYVARRIASHTSYGSELETWNKTFSYDQTQALGRESTVLHIPMTRRRLLYLKDSRSLEGDLDFETNEFGSLAEGFHL